MTVGANQKITVQWMELVRRTSWCIYPPLTYCAHVHIQELSFCAHAINYTVVVTESSGVTVEQTVVTSDSCRNGRCSTNFTLSADQNYIISITAGSVFGRSGEASIDLICTRLTTANEVLLAVGVLLLIAAIVICICLIVMKVVLTKGL